MADFNYDKCLELLLAGDIDLAAATIKATLCTATYTANQSTHDYFDDVTGRVATATLASKTVTGGVFDAADLTFPTVASGSTVTQIVIWLDSGSEATSPLIRKIDSYTGLPFSTNDLDVTLAWPNDASKIFRLVNA